MNMEHWWKMDDGGNPKHLEKNLSHTDNVPHKFHMECPGI
jgi:hypothetical protein